METVTINGKKIQFPTNWAELQENRKLFLSIIKLFFLNLKEQELLNYAALKMVGMSDIQIIRITNVIENPKSNPQSEQISANLFRISELAKFVTDTLLEITQKFFNRLKNYFAPESVIKIFTAWEYALSEKAFFDFVEKKDEQFLNKLIAIIYRPKKKFYFIRKYFKNFNPDKRQAYSDAFLNKRIKRVSKFPYHVKWLIFRWFAWQREIIIKAHKYTFSGGSKSNKKIDIGSIWTDTILAMSEVGNEDKTANTKLSIILRRIENDNRNYEEQKQKTDE